MKNNTDISINLASLIDLSARLNETFDTMFILNSALLSLMGKLRVARGCILEPDMEQKSYKLLLSKGRTISGDMPFFELPDRCELDEEIQDSQARELYQAGMRLCLPVRVQNQLIAVVALGGKLGADGFTNTELHYIDLVITIAATALKNARYHKSLITTKNNLELRNQLLTTLFELGRDFSTLLSKEEIIKMMSYHLMGQLMVSRFALFLHDESKERSASVLVINRFDSDPAAIVAALEESYEPQKISSAILTDELRDQALAEKIELSVPMVIHGQIRGWLLVGRKLTGKDYADDDVQFIEALGSRAISALENERLFQEELAKKKLESELELALGIQKNLLPKFTPGIKGYDLAGSSLPSLMVGGDYYDFISLDDHRMLLTIADVSGKGMPAALLMANVQAALRVLAPLDLQLTELTARINKIVWQNTTPDKFVTSFCGILDSDDHTFTYLNAGHNPPYLLHDQNIEPLDRGGLILGVLEQGIQYEQGKVKLGPGDVIVMYTDGITEALNHKDEEYGEERLENRIKHSNKLASGELMKKIIDDVKSHSDGRHQFDDITIITLKRVE